MKKNKFQMKYSRPKSRKINCKSKKLRSTNRPNSIIVIQNHNFSNFANSGLKIDEEIKHFQVVFLQDKFLRIKIVGNDVIRDLNPKNEYPWNSSCDNISNRNEMLHKKYKTFFGNFYFNNCIKKQQIYTSILIIKMSLIIC